MVWETVFININICLLLCLILPTAKDFQLSSNNALLIFLNTNLIIYKLLEKSCTPGFDAKIQHIILVIYLVTKSDN